MDNSHDKLLKPSSPHSPATYLTPENDIRQLEKQLQEISSHYNNLKTELNGLRQQTDGIPQRISGINAELARLEASDKLKVQAPEQAEELHQTLKEVSLYHQTLLARERELQSKLLRIGSEKNILENELKVCRIKAG
ncbi:hypothetical protein [Endozoicomonas sp. Mp262]|uniref:hypothetical protein n=1 Tax=Endozoicomonas sp. Mp262 TaxID=2919499 RepID=UPI0021DB6348